MYGNPQNPGYVNPQFGTGYANPAAMDFSAAKPAPPKSNAGWVVASILFFWPVAFAAANHSSQVYPLWATGDYAGAEHASAQAKKLGKIALLAWAVLSVLFIIVYIAIIAAAISSASDISSYSNY